MDNKKFDLFISYSRKDTLIVNKICDVLDEQGIKYFIDRKGLAGGGEFPAELEEAIDSSILVLFIASKNSYSSKFTIGEITYAFNSKEKGNVIPYVIDDSSLLDIRGMKLIFSNVNIRNIKNHPIENILIQDICARLGRDYHEPEALRKERLLKETIEKQKKEEEIRQQIEEEFRKKQEAIKKQHEFERQRQEAELKKLQEQQERLLEDKRRREELQALENAEQNRRETIRHEELEKLRKEKEDKENEERIARNANIKKIIDAIIPGAIPWILFFIVIFAYIDVITYWMFCNGIYSYFGGMPPESERSFSLLGYFRHLSSWDWSLSSSTFIWHDFIICCINVFFTLCIGLFFAIGLGMLLDPNLKEEDKDTPTIQVTIGLIFGMIPIATGIGYLHHSFFHGLLVWIISVPVIIIVSVLAYQLFVKHIMNKRYEKNRFIYKL